MIAIAIMGAIRGQAASLYSNAVMVANPVGYWRLNETNSTAGGTLTAVDVTGNHNAVYGAAVIDGVAGPGPANGFLGLESSNTGAQFTSGIAQSFVNIPALNLNANTVTITAWVYPVGTPGSFCGIVFCRPGSDASGFNFTTGGQLGYTWNQNNSATYRFNSGLVPPLQQWSLVALVISPSSAVIYMCNTNGIQSATNAIAHTAEAFNAKTLIGDDSNDGGTGARSFNGLMDEVAIFNTSLTQSQVLNLYFSAVSGAPQATTPVASPSTNLYVGNTLVLTETALGVSPFQYQWRTNGIPLAGATNSSLVLSNVTQANSGNYSVIISNSLGGATSAPVTISVTVDTTPPVVLGAFNIGVSNVQLAFSKTLAPTNATNAANYVFTNGIAVAAASLSSNQTAVLLTTAAPLVYGSNYTLVINGLRDQAIPPNTIATNTTVHFIASPEAPVDVGIPPIPSSFVVVSNGLIVTATGSDIGGVSDQFNLEYQLRSGDFDVSVRVAGLSPSDVWAKAALMARESLAVDSRFAASVATPAMNGCFFEWRDPASTPSSSSGAFPANYPDTWLRLKRSGSTFTGFAGYDGQSWSQLGSIVINMSNQVYLGFALTSHNINQPATAQFLDEADVGTNNSTVVITNPHEQPGPSSRKTGVIISEIMYKPAPRVDGNNLEFLEIYNSNPWFHDISGYHIVCADMNYTFPSNTVIPGGAYFVVAASPQGLQNVYGPMTNVFGPYSGSLKKSETLQLLDEQGAVLLTIPYSNVYPWPVAADGTGHSIVLANPTYGEGDPCAWDISDIMGGSPGQMDAFRPSPLRNIVINEILPHSENLAVPQFIELYNHSTNTVDISGCILTDNAASNKFVIPAGTHIGASGFVSFTQSQIGFALNGAGGTLFLIKPDGSRILDAMQFEAQADGISFGRWPDGANDFYALASRTPGTNNSPILIGDVVINELMYKPISGNDDDQYIELYNKGTNSANISGWQFTSGVTFNFPANTVIQPNGYLVVARNLANLLAKYTNLNSANAIGNYGGKLSHNGERVALAMPQILSGSNTIYVVEDEVTYGVGGRWGQWSGGGGSSLELIDPHSNHRLAANWADSDETQKSAWTNIEYTGVLDLGANYESGILHAQIGLLDVGECLVDNVEVDFNGTNYVSNPGFETGTNGWSFQGCMTRSSIENSGYGGSSNSLHIRCSDRIWTGLNSCQMTLNTNPLGAGQTNTLRFKARWLRGWPEALLRLNGNWLEATGTMPVPANLGTPGLPNSRYTTNAGPAIYQVTHTPPLPLAGQAAVVTARVHDPDGVKTLTLNYRIDPATNYTSVPMKDDGTGGDAVAHDGIFSATIPGQNANTIVAFYISASDSNSAPTIFPAALNDRSPTRECLVMFGDGNPGGSFGIYHLWISQTNVTRWANLSDLSNEENDFTFVTGNRVVYNALGRFAGSPYHQDFDTPSGSLCHYKWVFPDDDMLLGATDFNKIHQPGNSAGDDGSLQREQTSYTFLRALGEPWLYRRYVAVYVNGNRRGPLMEDTQVPTADMVKEYFPNDSDGYLYKMQPWFEFPPLPSGSTIGFTEEEWVTLNSRVTTGGVKKTARYRYNYEIRRTPDSDNNFAVVYALIDAANSYGSPGYVANMQNLANMENWMRVFAANHAAANRDSFGATTEQNLYGYSGTQGTKYSLLMFDFNICLDHGAWGPGQNLFLVNSDDPYLADIYNEPTFRRMYWRALQELVNGPLNMANSAPLCNAKYSAFVANGLSVEDPNSSILPWIGQAGASIAAQIAVVNAASFSVNPVTISNNLAILTGQAPFNVSTIFVNGAAYPLTWTSLTSWTIIVPLVTGTNQFNVVGFGRNNQPIAGASNTASVVFNSGNPSPVGQVVINEIMYAPAASNAQFLELYNNSTNTAFDLSGWQLQGLSYTFPNGSIIGPSSFLVLTPDRATFAEAYGATVPVFDTFNATLPVGGTLALLTAANLTVTKVKYDSHQPWPTNANGTGASLQLIDSRQDNWRAGNWAANVPAATPGSPNSVATTLAPFPPLWLNELQPNNVNGITNRVGQHTPWLELYNPGSNLVSLNGLYLANNYSNLLQWPFPSNAVINPGQFKVIFADGQTNLSTTNELHTSFSLLGGTGSLALTRLATNAQQQVLDYVDYQNVISNDSYGSFPDGQSFLRQEFFQATPGAPNNGVAIPPPSFIEYSAPGSVYSQNFDSLPAPSTNSVNSDNPVTINSITYSLPNPFDFAFPIAGSGNGGLGLTAMAGWYGLGDLGSKFGATDGDQTTGGQISFGLTGSSNRALGLLATSSVGGTAFGARFINGTVMTLSRMNLQFTGELWRQSDKPKTLQFYYFIDPTGVNGFPAIVTAFLPALNVSFPTNAADSGGVAVNGTLPQYQTNLAVFNQPITNWPPGAALWLVWQMLDSTGKAQGLAVDNLSFSANIQPPPVPLAIQLAGTNILVSWLGSSNQSYQLEYKDNLAAPAWTPFGSPVTGNGHPLTLTNSITNSGRFFRLRLVN